MEGPTPVSALIHAATMVTAGVFMVARLSPLFELAPVALAVVAAIGATTAFFAATVALCQTDNQAGHRLFDLQPARLHVLRRWGLGLFGGDLPSDDPRLLQGFAVPRRRVGDPRHVERAGHAQDGRVVEAHSADLRRHVGGQPGARRGAVLLWLFLQGPHPRGGVRRGFDGRPIRLLAGHRCRRHDRVLRVAAAVHDLPWRAPGERRGHGAGPRIAQGHDHPAGPACHRRDLRRLLWGAHRHGRAGGRVLARQHRDARRAGHPSTRRMVCPYGSSCCPSSWRWRGSPWPT